MPIFSIRSQFADLLAEAKELLGEHTEEEIHEVDLDHLEDQAEALVDHLHEHSDDYAPNAIKRAEELHKEIEALDVDDDDFEDDFAELESELHDMAERLGFDLPEPEPDEDDTRVIAPAVIRDGIANDPRIVFDDKVTPDKLANYALATSLYSPVGQSAFHQRQQGLTLLLAGLLARGSDFTTGPPPQQPPPSQPPPSTGGPPSPPVIGGPPPGEPTIPVTEPPVVVTPPTKPPKDDIPKDDIPKDDIPKDDIPKDDIPKDDIPKDDFPKDDIPKDHIPKDDFPKDHIPKDDFPKDDIPKDDIPKDDFPKDDIPKDDIPKDKVPKDGEPKGPIFSDHIKEEVLVAPPSPVPPFEEHIIEEEILVKPPIEEHFDVVIEDPMRQLIERVIPGGNAARPDLAAQLSAAGVRTPEELLTLTARNWTRNVNEGVHLRNQLARILGSDHERALPPASDLDSLVKAARRERRDPEQPVA